MTEARAQRLNVLKLGGQKLAESMHAIVEDLKFSCEEKTEPKERAVKQLVELYGGNGRL